MGIRPVETKLAYTIDESVEAGAGSRTKVYEAINAGALKAKKRGRSTVILTDDANAYLENLPDYKPAQAAANG